MSETPKFTPGPWNASDAYVFAGNDCIGMTDTDNATTEVYDANARLMAAAPDLFSALTYAIKCGERDGAKSALAALLTQGRAALAKARGEQS